MHAVIATISWAGLHAKMKRPIYCLSSASIWFIRALNNPLFVMHNIVTESARRRICTAVALSYQTWNTVYALELTLQNSSNYKSYFKYVFRYLLHQEPGWFSPYSDHDTGRKAEDLWLHFRQCRESFFIPIAPRSALGPTQPLAQGPPHSVFTG
jgi:hypothetical protein